LLHKKHFYSNVAIVFLNNCLVYIAAFYGLAFIAKFEINREGSRSHQSVKIQFDASAERETGQH
jgi:hypothetical protein